MPARTVRSIGATCALLAGVGASLLVLDFLRVVNVRRCFCDAEVQLILATFSSIALAALVGVFRDADRVAGLCALALGIVGQVGAAITLSVAAVSDRRIPLSDCISEHRSWLVIIGVRCSNYHWWEALLDWHRVLQFPVTGSAILVLSWLVLRTPALPPNLGGFGMVTGLGLVMTYIVHDLFGAEAKWILLTPDVPAAFVLVPIWLVWLGISLNPDRGRPPRDGTEA